MSWESRGWTHQKATGGLVEVVEDSYYGQVLRYTVAEELEEARIQLSKAGPPLSPPCTARLPLWLSEDFRPPDEQSWANLLTVLSSTPETDRAFDVLASIDVGRSLVPNLNVKQPYNVDETLHYYPGKTALAPQEWHLIELSVDPAGTLTLFLDGAEQVSGEAHEGGRIAVESLHGGAYGVRLPKDSFVLNGPLELICY